MLKPKDIFNYASEIAVEKGGYSLNKILVLCLLEGYIYQWEHYYLSFLAFDSPLFRI